MHINLIPELDSESGGIVHLGAERSRNLTNWISLVFQKFSSSEDNFWSQGRLFNLAECSLSCSFIGSHNPTGSKNSAIFEIMIQRDKEADLRIDSASSSVTIGVGLGFCVPRIFLLTFNSDIPGWRVSCRVCHL